MDTSAPPVIRGEFIYQDILLVDVGGILKRHSRASQTDLKTFLDGKAPKDQVAHWYEARLIHYGLQRSKDKNTAKVRLQQALNQEKLAVPPHIADMEEQMKKEFAANVRKARTAATKALQDAESSVGTPACKKRKPSSEGTAEVSAASKKTKATMKIGDVEVSIDHDTAESGSRKRKQQATPVKATKVQPSGKQKAAQAPKSSPSKPPPQTPKPKTEPKIKQPSPSARSPTKKTHQIKREIKQEPDKDDETTPRNITGVYNISCPQVEARFVAAANNLRLRLCVDNEAGKIWGSFEMVTKSGVLLIADEYKGTNVSLSFGWRARDLDSGRLSFGRGCFGEIVFFGFRQVRGTFFNLFPEPVDFEGERRMGPLWCGKSASQFEREWDGYVKEAYGR